MQQQLHHNPQHLQHPQHQQSRLKVHRRRPGSSRRLSHVVDPRDVPATPDGGPSFRPLDVLICEDHPVSRMVMEKLLDEISFEAPDMTERDVTIDEAYVDRMLADIVENDDLSRYVL